MTFIQNLAANYNYNNYIQPKDTYNCTHRHHNCDWLCEKGTLLKIIITIAVIYNQSPKI